MTDKYKLRDILNTKTILNPIWIDTLISKLDPEMQEMLMMIVEDAYEEGEYSADRYSYSDLDRAYDRGYEDGYAAGHQEGKIEGIISHSNQE